MPHGVADVTADTVSARAVPLDQIRIRRAEIADVARIAALDERITGVPKSAYWTDLHERYRSRRSEERFIFLAEAADHAPDDGILGFVIGEVRAWEFGSTPCGWVFAISVDASAREHRVGERLLQAISEAFKRAGMDKMRTMISRNNVLLMSFFRSEGMMAGPYIQLEKDLD